jgi:hypothetical protein
MNEKLRLANFVAQVVIILLDGFKLLGFSLDHRVLATLVGSTAIAAIGLVGFIARGLFRPPPKN